MNGGANRLAQDNEQRPEAEAEAEVEAEAGEEMASGKSSHLDSGLSTVLLCPSNAVAVA